MIRFVNLLIVMSMTVFLITSCGANKTENTGKSDQVAIPAKVNEEGEAYLNSIDFDESLNMGNSLYYSKGDGDELEWSEVVMFVDDSNNVQKFVERNASGATGIVASNMFYFKNGKKYATKQYFQEGEQDSLYFVELLSYYNENEEVKATMRRTAPFEDFLDQETFTVAPNTDCSLDRAMRIINQQEEFETTFQGFVDMDAFQFLVVGENKKDGYSTALIVQQITPLILELRANESEMIGTPLEVQFQTVQEGGGTEQILLSASKK